MLAGSFAVVSIGAAVGCAAAFIPLSDEGRSPASVAAELLAADRAFSAASAKTDLISGLTNMLHEIAIMPARPHLIWSRDSIAIALRADTANAGSKAVWIPIRVGLAADGRSGFTLGYMTVTRANGAVVPMKYLSYWTKTRGKWRVITYNRGRRAEGNVSLAMRPAILPAVMVKPIGRPGTVIGFAEEVRRAEIAFSHDATARGIVKAFEDFGTEESYNMGGPGAAEWIVGSKGIAQGVGSTDGSPAPTWVPIHAGAASSGDLGFTAGI
ncbi:MAG TPA: hypothetical protein VNO75_05900, partial [Gemmatimonadaceae bacterium]|nr:hypothetical protein [Gemmatimonadaceae bacterium]